MKPRILFLVGPTATGKTAVAVVLARALNAEIVSCDSMQVYKKMDIITSKPGKRLSRSVKHHLVGSIGPAVLYDVSRYRRDAVKKIKEIVKRGKLPLFVGGTGLYMSVLIDGIFKLKAQDRAVREKFYKEAQAKGSQYLYKKLQKVDPEAAAKIHPNDTKRIIRALEVFKVTGQPISRLQKQRIGLAHKYDISIFALDMARDRLYKRIEERVEKMFQQGLVKEARSLCKSKLSRTASCAIGLRELRGYFDGAYGLDEAKSLIKRNTRRYAKRQLTWFRKDRRINWVHVSDKEVPGRIAERIICNGKSFISHDKV